MEAQVDTQQLQAELASVKEALERIRGTIAQVRDMIRNLAEFKGPPT